MNLEEWWENWLDPDFLKKDFPESDEDREFYYECLADEYEIFLKGE